MKQLFLLLSLLATTHLTGFAYEKPTKAELLQIGLPVLQIETVNHEEPTYEEANPPEGCIGAGIKMLRKYQDVSSSRHLNRASYLTAENTNLRKAV